MSNTIDEQTKQEVYANLPNEHCTIMQDMVVDAGWETWQPTAELRWLEETKYIDEISGWTDRTLQQKWVSYTGEVEWREVPTVKEEK